MKIYEVKAWTISFCIITGMLSLLIFGMIWLNEGFKVQQIMADSNNHLRDQLVNKYDEELKKQSVALDELKNSIMPSAFKGKKK